jgi:hypothetical protein
MGTESTYKAQRERAYEFVANVFGMTADESARARTPAPPGREFSAATPRKNQPEFWADAPWRIEPDCEILPLSFIIRDADVQPPGKGPWKLHGLEVAQRLADGTWHEVCRYLPADLPDLDAGGYVTVNFWTFRADIPLTGSSSPCTLATDQVRRGGPRLHLRVQFVGSFHPHQTTETSRIHLEVSLAEHPLPQGRAVQPSGGRHWFYGDTHYHSSYTNDVKEFGGPISETRDAALSIGLDWLVVTDHSCDLDEADDDPQGSTRWARLGETLSTSGVSDDRFRFLLGEEITLRGGEGERYVHMLACGGMQEMVEGGFLPEGEGGFVTRLFQQTIEELLEKAIKDGGYHPHTAKRLFGPVHSFDEVLRALPDSTLAFAAHPYSIAQPPFIDCDWAEEDLAHPRLTGHEFWNGRSRRRAMLTDDPFSKPGWTDRRKLGKNDRSRLRKLQEKVDRKWDAALRSGVDEWLSGVSLPLRRPVFVAGSDAHGSFNYSVGWGWDYQTQLLCNDNALGTVRTAIHLPGHTTSSVPETSDILAALRKGSCVVTDGPLIEISLRHGGDTAYMGDLLAVTDDGELEMRVVAHTTPEFGAVEQVEVVTYAADRERSAPPETGWLGRLLGRATTFFRRIGRKGSRVTRVKAGQSKTIALGGSQAFCRVQAYTSGLSGERFCCFTNPIWVRAPDGRHPRIHVHFAP